MSIQALPHSTVRQIGSTQVLTDPSSVVKELIDNALDARATNISVEISSNTIDLIQVRDNGHGIMQEDRTMVCRRYCTSKIRDFEDLKDLGGSSLGFRGEALASLAETSGGVSIITRVEGENVAVLLKIGRGGEIEAQERASHPVGTTVRAVDFFKTFPVRKQAALKHSVKFVARIKHLMQAYALARPGVRFSLRVLKAKTDKGNWIYAPKKGASLEDAAFKVVGKHCATQCEWSVLESNGFQLQAFLPKADAKPGNVSGFRQFISVDSRPVSSSRGTFKQICGLYKEKIRKAGAQLRDVKDPFLCLNLVCPTNSYDPNVEPGKDDVLFDDSRAVLGLFGDLLAAFYPEPATQPEVSQSAIEEEDMLHEGFLEVPTAESSGVECEPAETELPSAPKRRRTWKANMYDYDDDDFEGSTMERPEQSVDERDNAEREDVQPFRENVTLSNPWTIAKMNSTVKYAQPSDTIQPPTPLRGCSPAMLNASSSLRYGPTRIGTEDDGLPLTPIASSTVRVSNSNDGELARSIQRLVASNETGAHFNQPRYDYGLATPQPSSSQSRSDFNPAQRSGPGTQLSDIPSASNKPRRSNRLQQHTGKVNKPFVLPTGNREDNWFPHLSQLKRKAPPKRSQASASDSGNVYSPPHSRTFNGSAGPDISDRHVPRERNNRSNRDIRDFVTANNSSSFNHHSTQIDTEPTASPSFRPAHASPTDLFVLDNPTNAAAHSPPSEIFDEFVVPAMLPSAQGGRRRSERILRRRTSDGQRNDENNLPAERSGLVRGLPPARRRTTNGDRERLQRTRSSLLPLETVPNGSRVQNVSLRCSVSARSIYIGQKMLTTSDTPDNAVQDAFPKALDPATLEEWTTRLAALLRKHHPGEEMVQDMSMFIAAALRERGT